MSTSKIMQWVDFLPGCGGTIFQARRNELEELKREADELLRQAEAKRARIYFDACRLEGLAKEMWSTETIELAKKRAS